MKSKTIAFVQLGLNERKIVECGTFVKGMEMLKALREELTNKGYAVQFSEVQNHNLVAYDVRNSLHTYPYTAAAVVEIIEGQTIIYSSFMHPAPLPIIYDSREVALNTYIKNVMYLTELEEHINGDSKNFIGFNNGLHEMGLLV